MSAMAIPKDILESRVQKVVAQWPWKSADALLVLCSQPSDTNAPAKVASMLHQFLFTVEFPELVLLVERSGQATIMGTSKKLNYFEKLQLPWLKLVQCDKKFTEEDQQKFLEIVRGLSKKGEKLVLATPSETHLGRSAEEVTRHLEAADFVQTMDASPGIRLLLASKDEVEVQQTKKACLFACLYMQEVIFVKWMDALDEELRTSPSAVVEELQALVDREDGVKGLCAKLSIDSSEIEVANHIIQSGRHIELNLGAVASHGELAMSGTFLLGVVVKYGEYHAALTRTYLVNPSQALKQDYQCALTIMKRVIEALKAGAKCQDVYAAAKDYLNQSHADLSERFGENVGFMTGLSLQDKTWTLSADCEKEVPPDSIFLVTIMLKPRTTSADTECVWLTETVFVPATGKAEVLTAQATSQQQDVMYEENEEEDPPPPAPKPASTQAAPERKRSRSRERASGASKPDAKAKAQPSTTARTAGEQAPKAKAKAKAKGAAKAAAKEKDPSQASMTSFTRPAKPKEKATPEPRRAETRRAEPPRKPAEPAKAPARRKPAEPESRKSTRLSGQPQPPAGPTMGRATRSTTQRAKEAFAEQVELEERQKLLRNQKLVELQQRFAEHGVDGFGGQAASGKRSIGECQAYTNPSTLPKMTGPPKLRIDMDAEALLVPYRGAVVPFHVKTIRTMTRNEHDGLFFFRVNFYYPGQGKSAEEYPRAGEKTAYIKELLFKSHEKEMFDTCFENFKEVQRKVRDGNIKAQHKEEAQQQQATPLKEIKGGPVIRDVSIRPALRTSGQKTLGNFEAHANGLRYFIRGSIEKLEIPYTHIKTAIFQPAERGSLVVYIHIHLKPDMGLMVGRRMSHHIQIYTEVRNQVEDLTKRRGPNSHDPDEVMEEQREEQLKQRINQAFKEFSQKLEKIPNFPVKFEVAQEGPFQFYGVPHKANVRLFCCRDSLVGIEEHPWLVVNMHDVELVVFERALTMTREFDMALVLKNYNEQPIRITMIPSQSMGLLKSWLADLHLVWYTVALNMQWSAVMREVLGDMQKFIDNGGWQGWFEDDSEEEDAAAKDDDESDWTDREDDDDDFAGDIEEDSSAEAEVEEDEDDDEDPDEDEDYADDDDDEESGKDWDELEREAEEEDRRATKRGGGRAGAAKAPARSGRR